MIIKPEELKIVYEKEDDGGIRPVYFIDAEQKTGKWIDTPNYYQRWKCSLCGCHTRDIMPNYCPNCGAKMKGDY